MTRNLFNGRSFIRKGTAVRQFALALILGREVLGLPRQPQYDIRSALPSCTKLPLLAWSTVQPRSFVV